MSKPYSITVANESGDPMIVARVDQWTSLDVLFFMQQLTELIDMELLARREGRTFEHALGQSIGPLPIDVVLGGGGFGG